MDYERIEQMVRVLRESPRLSEVEVRQSGSTLRLRRAPLFASPARHMVAPRPARAGGGNGALSPAAPPAATTVTAELVGVFRVARPPAGPGDQVVERQIIGHIESMRLSNDCVAPSGGRIAAVLVEDGQPVEYGQPLFSIATSSEERKP